MWPQPSMISTRAPGIADAVAWIRSGGVEPSWSPPMHSTGTVMVAETSEKSASRIEAQVWI
ncbi:hypothetical protein D3C87_2009740 [compost metagenome]